MAVPTILESLIERCDKSKLKTIFNPDDDEEGIFAHLAIEMPADRSHVTLIIPESDEEAIEDLKTIDFEQFRFIDGYYAIYSPSRRYIEAVVETPQRVPPVTVLRRIHRIAGTERQMPTSSSEPTSFADLPPVQVNDTVSGLNLRIGPPSQEAKTLLDLSELATLGPRFQRVITLQIEEVAVDTHNKARDILEKLGNAFLFQLDLLTEIPLYIAPLRESRLRVLPPLRSKSVGLNIPEYEYENQPISLYWYARSASGLPLLQFLAFYQVIEFYFPAYSMRESQRILQNRLKDPSFNLERDSDVAALLTSLKTSSRGGFGSEKEQILAVLKNCVDSDDLRDFLTEDEQKASYFREKRRYSVVSDVRVPIGESDSDVLGPVATRVYDIRCKVVHSKGDQPSAQEVILPFSKEAQQMNYDIDLVRFIARKVLVTSSTRLRL